MATTSSTSHLIDTLSSLEVAVDAMRSLHQVLLDRATHAEEDLEDDEIVSEGGRNESLSEGEGEVGNVELLQVGGGSTDSPQSNDNQFLQLNGGPLQDSWERQAQRTLAGLMVRNSSSNSGIGRNIDSSGSSDSGCPPSLIDSLTTIRAPHCDQNGVLTGACPICQEEKTSYSHQTELKTFIEISPCGHRYCRDCIIPWLNGNTTCPVCRATVVPGEGKIVEWKVRELVLNKGESLSVRARLGSAPVHRLRGLTAKFPLLQEATSSSNRPPTPNTTQCHAGEGDCRSSSPQLRQKIPNGRPPTAASSKPQRQPERLVQVVLEGTATANNTAPFLSRPLTATGPHSSMPIRLSGNTSLFQRATTAGQRRSNKNSTNTSRFPASSNNSSPSLFLAEGEDSNTLSANKATTTPPSVNSATAAKGVIGGTSLQLRQRPISAPRAQLSQGHRGGGGGGGSEHPKVLVPQQQSPLDQAPPPSSSPNGGGVTLPSALHVKSTASVGRVGGVTGSGSGGGQSELRRARPSTAATQQHLDYSGGSNLRPPSTAAAISATGGSGIFGATGRPLSLLRAGSAALTRPRKKVVDCARSTTGTLGGGRVPPLRSSSALSGQLALHSIHSNLRVSGTQFVPRPNQVL